MNYDKCELIFFVYGDQFAFAELTLQTSFMATLQAILALRLPQTLFLS